MITYIHFDYKPTTVYYEYNQPRSPGKMLMTGTPKKGHDFSKSPDSGWGQDALGPVIRSASVTHQSWISEV